MNISEVIDDELYQALIKISKDDTIVGKALVSQIENKNQLIQVLASTIVCVCYREMANQLLIKELLDSNPLVKTMLQAKHDITNIPKNPNQG